MLKYFILLLISLTCLASEPKFHYMECVRVISGFYKGCKGNVVSYNPGDKNYSTRYSVQADDCRNAAFVSDFDESELKGCEK